MGLPVEEATPYTRVSASDDGWNIPGCECLLRCLCCIDEDVVPHAGGVQEKSRGGFRCCDKRTLLKIVVAVTVVFIAATFGLCHMIASNTRCHPGRLEGQPTPEPLLPDHIWLEPRETWFGFTQQLDVWAANPPSTTLGARVGQFYDVRIPFVYFSLAYQDLDGRVWFHAKTPGLFSRVSWWPGDEFEVERCDMPVNSTAAAYRIKQEVFEGSWFCFSNCRRVYSVRLHSSPFERVARVTFDSALTWIFGKSRHQWSMQMTPARDRRTTIASAQSHVFPAPSTKRGQVFKLLSRWNVDVSSQAPGEIAVPNWAAAFMAAMDEMEGTDEETDVDDSKQ